MPLVSRTRATLRSAEFGFFGVVVYTRVHTPRRWGEPFSAGVLVFSTLSSRPLRTSWLIVGMGGLDLLPALGRAVDVVRCLVVPGRPARPILAVTHRPAPAFGRVAPRENRPADRAGLVAPRASARHPIVLWGWPLRSGRPGGLEDVQAHHEREQAQITLGTADHSTRPSRPGQSRVDMGPETAPAGLFGANRGRCCAIPGRALRFAPRGRRPGRYPTTALVRRTTPTTFSTVLLSYPSPTVGAEPLTARC